MSRDIKFRVWNKYTEEMDNSPLLRGDNSGVVYTAYEDCPLMQYTGLKDKNGVEIYEGDIFSMWKDNSKPQIVSWNRCGFSPLPDEEYIEVIGNIYQNPELLEVSNE